MKILKMVEIIKHSLGFCGEHWHPNLFTMIASGLGLSPALNYIYFKYIKRYEKKN
jgi:hypothetical protein